MHTQRVRYMPSGPFLTALEALNAKLYMNASRPAAHLVRLYAGGQPVEGEVGRGVVELLRRPGVQ